MWGGKTSIYSMREGKPGNDGTGSSIWTFNNVCYSLSGANKQGIVLAVGLTAYPNQFGREST